MVPPARRVPASGRSDEDGARHRHERGPRRDRRRRREVGRAGARGRARRRPDVRRDDPHVRGVARARAGHRARREAAHRAREDRRRGRPSRSRRRAPAGQASVCSTSRGCSPGPRADVSSPSTVPTSSRSPRRTSRTRSRSSSTPDTASAARSSTSSNRTTQRGCARSRASGRVRPGLPHRRARAARLLARAARGPSSGHRLRVDQLLRTRGPVRRTSGLGAARAVGVRHRGTAGERGSSEAAARPPRATTRPATSAPSGRSPRSRAARRKAGAGTSACRSRARRCGSTTSERRAIPTRRPVSTTATRGWTSRTQATDR